MTESSRPAAEKEKPEITAESVAGIASKYANPDLIPHEKEAWENAAAERYLNSFLPEYPEVEPDEWDLEMIRRSNEENDGETITLEELAEKLGIDYNSI